MGGDEHLERSPGYQAQTQGHLGGGGEEGGIAFFKEQKTKGLGQSVGLNYGRQPRATLSHLSHVSRIALSPKKLHARSGAEQARIAVIYLSSLNKAMVRGQILKGAHIQEQNKS